jgi:hypothetical protein
MGNCQSVKCDGCFDKGSPIQMKYCSSRLNRYCLDCIKRRSLVRVNRDDILILIKYYSIDNRMYDFNATNAKLSNHFIWNHFGWNWYINDYIPARAREEVTQNKTFYKRCIMTPHFDLLKIDFNNMQEMIKCYMNHAKYYDKNPVSRCSKPKCGGLCYNDQRTGLECSLCKDVKCDYCYESKHQAEQLCDPKIKKSVDYLNDLNVRPCPNCYISIYVYEGCNSVMCSGCNSSVHLKDQPYVRINFMGRGKYTPTTWIPYKLPSLPSLKTYEAIRELYCVHTSIKLFKLNQLCFFMRMEQIRNNYQYQRFSSKGCAILKGEYILKGYIALFAALVYMSEYMEFAYEVSKSRILRMFYCVIIWSGNDSVQAQLDHIMSKTGITFKIKDFQTLDVFKNVYGIYEEDLKVLYDCGLTKYF